MNDERKYQELFDKICLRLTQYMAEKRASTQPQKLADQISADSGYEYDPRDERIQEGLNEHVGLLPILATTIYPYLGRTDVDLGQALIMLAVHDIGETVTGDTIMFLKNDKDDAEEQKIAVQLLDPMYRDLYMRVENPADPTAQFAKSMDKTIGDFMDLLCPADITTQRYKNFMKIDTPKEIVDMKRTHKAKHFDWDPFMKGFFAYVLKQTETKLNS